MVRPVRGWAVPVGGMHVRASSRWSSLQPLGTNVAVGLPCLLYTITPVLCSGFPTYFLQGLAPVLRAGKPLLPSIYPLRSLSVEILWALSMIPLSCAQGTLSLHHSRTLWLAHCSLAFPWGFLPLCLSSAPQIQEFPRLSTLWEHRATEARQAPRDSFHPSGQVTVPASGPSSPTQQHSTSCPPVQTLVSIK